MDTNVFSPLLIVLATLILFGSVVLIHELGHFITAKLLGIKVVTFSVGFGRRLIETQFRGTIYCISLIPLGGYVRCFAALPENHTTEFKFSSSPLMRQLAPLGAKEIEILKMLPTNSPQNILTRSPGAIALFTMGGVTANILSAFIVSFVMIKFLLPLSELSRDLSIGEVLSGSPAAEAGVIEGDRIIAIDQKPVQEWLDIEKFLSESKNRDIDLTLERMGSSDQIHVTIHRIPMHRVSEGKSYDVLVSGFKPRREELFVSNKDAAVVSLSVVWQITLSIFGSQDEDRLGEQLSSMPGPIGGMLALGHEASYSMLDFSDTFISLSILLAILNLFPIPALDGGHLLMLLIEQTTRKPISPRLKAILGELGLAAMLILSGILFGKEAWTAIARLI